MFQLSDSAPTHLLARGRGGHGLEWVRRLGPAGGHDRLLVARHGWLGCVAWLGGKDEQRPSLCVVAVCWVGCKERIERELDLKCPTESYRDKRVTAFHARAVGIVGPRRLRVAWECVIDWHWRRLPPPKKRVRSRGFGPRAFIPPTRNRASQRLCLESRCKGFARHTAEWAAPHTTIDTCKGPSRFDRIGWPNSIRLPARPAESFVAPTPRCNARNASPLRDSVGRSPFEVAVRPLI